MDVSFHFAIGDRVRLKSSLEQGVIRALSIDHAGQQQARIHYVAADKRAVEGWWETDQIERV